MFGIRTLGRLTKLILTVINDFKHGYGFSNILLTPDGNHGMAAKKLEGRRWKKDGGIS